MSGASKPPTPANARPISQQIAFLMEMLRRVKGKRGDKVYKEVMRWVHDVAEPQRPEEVYQVIARAFDTTPDLVKRDINPNAQVKSFEHLVPRAGWLHDYIMYTRFTEPPTVFHFFVGLVVLGTVLRRNIHCPQGPFNIYPNMDVILVAPSGKCRKTTACEIGVKLVRETGGRIMPDQITPESLVDTFGELTEASGLIFAGELKQSLGSQKYMTGMGPLLTRLLDSPDVWIAKTLARGEVPLHNVCISFLGATTMDWLRELPSDMFGGGFMSRFILVVQEETERCFPEPPPMVDALRTKMIKRIVDLSHVRAQIHRTPSAREWYTEWYKTNKKIATEDKMFSGYFERKGDHLIRIAMILSIAEDDSNAFVIEKRHYEHALKILEWIEMWLPGAFEQLNINALGQDHLRMLHQLKKAGGEMPHSEWLRRNSARMNAKQFKDHVSTMREAKLVDFIGTKYYLTAEGWKR